MAKMAQQVKTTATVDGRGSFQAEYEISQETEYVRSELAEKPDPTWHHVDPAGHFHAFSANHEDVLPTLNAIDEHVDCDGSCGGLCEGEGYTRTRYECTICHAPVEPRWIPDYEARETGIPIPGLKDWSARLSGRADAFGSLLQPRNERVSVVITEEDRTLFGFGIIGDTRIESGRGDVLRAEVTIYGAGPLSQRL